MKNLFELIAKERNLALNEEFHWSEFEPRIGGKYKITTDNGLIYFDKHIGNYIRSEYLEEFIKGIGKITKLPFQPKQGEEYWIIDFTHDNTPYVINPIWKEHSSDYEHKMLGIVFRTKEEAEAYIPTYLEKLKEMGWKEYE